MTGVQTCALPICFPVTIEGAYGWYTTSEGQEVLVNIQSVNSERCSFVDVDNIVYYAKADKGISFKFIPINRRVFVYNGDVVSATRIPARQWQRGICQANTELRRVRNKSRLDVFFDTIKAYLSPVDRITSLYDVGCIDQRFCLPGGKSLCIYDTKIGRVKDEETVVLDDDLFMQELVDCFRDNSYSFKVMVK